MKRRTFSIVSLGCFRNTYDSEIVAERLREEGFSLVGLSAPKRYRKVNCHTLIINTCGFIDRAKEESIEAIKEAEDLKRKGKVKKILVFGCLIARYRKNLEKAFPQVDEWRGIEKFSQEFTPRRRLVPSYLGFLKICEGCQHKCSYCAIPLIKGELKSKPFEAAVKEAEVLDKQGVRELNIIGQDITSWGKDLSPPDDLTALLKNILKATKNIRWIRLMYTHPKNFSKSLIDLISQEERICKYIDLPIQHINDRILKLMGRKVTRKDIIRLIKRIRKKITNCRIRTSVIVGFPTEEEKEFIELLRFLGEIKFERLGAFIYSREDNTPAYNLSGQVHPSTKKRRFHRLMALQKDIARQANREFLGKEINVLIEERNKDVFVGRSEYDAYEVDGVVFIKREGLSIGDFYKTRIVDTYDYDLVGI